MFCYQELVGAGVLTYDVMTVGHHFTNILPHNVLDIYKKGPRLNYVSSLSSSSQTTNEDLILFPNVEIGMDNPWLKVNPECSTYLLQERDKMMLQCWRLLQQAKSHVKMKRIEATEKLAEIRNFLDSDALQLAQAITPEVAIGLARERNCDLRLLLTPPQLSKCDKVAIEKEFRVLLTSLPDDDVSECIVFATKSAIEKGHYFQTTEKESDWYSLTETSITNKGLQKVPQEQMEKIYLEALLSHSTVPSHCPIIVKLGGLQLLKKFLDLNRSAEAEALVAQIIANLTQDKSVHERICQAGWITILAHWMRSDDIKLSLCASRALANLDRDTYEEWFADGVYPIYPSYRMHDAHLKADIIFVHGLSGGVFKTWRQREGKNIKEDDVDSEIQDNPDTKAFSFRAIRSLKSFKNLAMPFQASAKDCASLDKTDTQTPGNLKGKDILDDFRYPPSRDVEYTWCWPKDWLPLDCPFIRVLGLDFETQLSEWLRTCPRDPEKHSISARSSEILEKLLQAGVGKRPIIWVSHSMGGIIVKKMLCLASESKDPEKKRVWENTKGIVFYSVPHFGSAWANWNPGTELLILPTIEVQELKKNSPQLLKIHEKFRKLIASHNVPILSFGETLKTRFGLKMEALCVEPSSSNPQCGEFHTISTNHINICKPISRTSHIYVQLVEFIFEHIPHSVIEKMMSASYGEIDIEKFIDNDIMW